MSVEQSKVIDFIGIDNDTREVVLTVSDHLGWEDSANHQRILQDKINSYLAFIESGEIFERYPEARNRSVAISIFFRYPPDDDGNNFLQKAERALRQAGYILKSRILAESQ